MEKAKKIPDLEKDPLGDSADAAPAVAVVDPVVGDALPVEQSDKPGPTCIGVNPFKIVHQSLISDSPDPSVSVAAIAGGAIVLANGIPVFVPGAVVRDLGNGMASFQ